MDDNTKPIKLKGDTHKKLKILAAQEEITLMDLVDKIINKYIEDKENVNMG